MLSAGQLLCASDSRDHASLVETHFVVSPGFVSPGFVCSNVELEESRIFPAVSST